MNKTKKVVLNDNIKTVKNTKKSLKQNNNSGSKTSKPLVKAKELVNDIKHKIDVEKVFDIIDSETKRNENKLKMAKNNKKILVDVNDDIDPKNKKIKKKDLVDVIVNAEKTKKSNTNNKDTINTIIEKPDNSIIKKNNEKINIPRTDEISKMAIKSYLEARQFLKDHNISISTITLDCKLHTLIDVDKFSKNVILREDEIVSVKFGNRKDAATNRTIVILKAKKKPSAKNFYNQVTILMKPTNNPSRNYINIKVFKNGSLQMTGCKDMDDFNNVTTTLINILKRGRDITNKKGKIEHIDFIDNPKKVGIFDVKIRMINSNFKLQYKVDRKKLARLLKKNHRLGTKDKDIGYVDCKYEPTGGHSCVNIKYKYDDTSRPSIFVFQTGAVIITGAKNLHHIIMAYHFIHKILNRYHNEIKIIELNPSMVNAELAKFLKNKKNEKLLALN